MDRPRGRRIGVRCVRRQQHKAIHPRGAPSAPLLALLHAVGVDARAALRAHAAPARCCRPADRLTATHCAHRYEQKKKNTIGRTAKSNFCVKDASVSEKHGEIKYDGERWVIVDTNSSNGTMINGVACAPKGTRGPRGPALRRRIPDRRRRPRAPTPLPD